MNFQFDSNLLLGWIASSHNLRKLHLALQMTVFRDEDPEIWLLNFREVLATQQPQQFRSVMLILKSDVKILEQSQWRTRRRSVNKLNQSDTVGEGEADGAANMAHIEQTILDYHTRMHH
jgi:hypothetical protein